MENADADLRKLRLTHFIPQEQGTFQVQELATEQQELLLCRLSYLSGLCIDVDIELNRRRDGVLLPVFLFFVMCDVLT